MSTLRAERLPPILAAGAFALAFFFLPGTEFPKDGSVAVFDRDGILLGAGVSATGQWRFPPGLPLPDKYVRALLAFEDRRFFSHPGIDPAALARAFLQNARAGRVVSGGSTIGMQAARLARPGRPRRLPEKAVEAWLALRLEFLLGKRGLLELYAANAPFGGNVVGLEAASFRFFGREPADLSWAEAATLAVLPNAPSAASPGKNRELLLAKRDRLLLTLAGLGALSETDVALALGEPLPAEPSLLPRLVPWLVARYAGGRVTGDPAGARADGGVRVQTTIDEGLQERCAEIAAGRLARLSPGGIRNAAVLVARVDTGEVLAYVANANLGSAAGAASTATAASSTAAVAASVDLIRAPRSSGSLLKPFLYAAALDSGAIGPGSLLPDLPTRYGSYGPENSSGTWAGAVPADEALARSLNVPFVRLLRDFGVGRFRDLLVSTGMTTLGRPAADYGLTLVLGGAETTLWEMTGRYAALARLASRAPGTGAGSGSGASPPAATGTGLPERFDLGLTAAELAARRLLPSPLSPGAALLALDALTRVARPGEEAAWEDFASSRRIGWKTGTSFGNRDAWAVGTDGDWAVGVWVGNATGEGWPGLRGSTAAAPVLFEVFRVLAMRGTMMEGGAAAGSAVSAGTAAAGAAAASTVGATSALRAIATCADSGWAAGPDCARTEAAFVPAGAQALAGCPYCRSVALSLDGAWRVRPENEDPDDVVVARRFVLPPAMEALYRHNLDYRPLPPWKPGNAPPGGDQPLALVTPEGGASLYIPIEIDGRPGATVFVAAHRDPEARLFWHLDGSLIGTTVGDHRLEARPDPGEHVLTLTDGDGNEVSRRFDILSDS